MSSINSIDKYGFSELFYADYWQNNEIKSNNLKNRGASHHESLKEYFKTENPRKEIINIYNRFSTIDFKNYLYSGCYIYLYDGLKINYAGLEECDLWRYLDTKKTQEFIVKELNKLFVFDIKEFIMRKYFEHITIDYEFNWNSIDSDTFDFYLDNADNFSLAVLEKINEKINFSIEQKRKISRNYKILKFPIDFNIFDKETLLEAVNYDIRKSREEIKTTKGRIIGTWDKPICEKTFEDIPFSLNDLEEIERFMNKNNKDYNGMYDEHMPKNAFERWVHKNQQIQETKELIAKKEKLLEELREMIGKIEQPQQSSVPASDIDDDEIPF